MKEVFQVCNFMTNNEFFNFFEDFYFLETIKNYKTRQLGEFFSMY
jgi:hypothetical protein